MTLTQLVQSILVSGTATTIAVQMMKSQIFPFPAEKSPRLTAFVVSLIASAIAVMQGGFDFTRLTDWTSYLPVVCGTFFISAITYEKVYKAPQPSVAIT